MDVKYMYEDRLFRADKEPYGYPIGFRSGLLTLFSPVQENAELALWMDTNNTITGPVRQDVTTVILSAPFLWTKTESLKQRSLLQYERF
jgi:hypothetical protein